MSYALIARDAMLSRLQAMPYFAGFARVSRTKMLPIMGAEQIPYLGCYFISESLTPDGDANAGEPRFRSLARYGFSVIILNNEPNLAEAQIDLAFDTITSLFTDPTLYINKAAKIQAFAAGDRTHVYGAIGLNNELPVAELRFDLTLDLGTFDWPPTVEDDLTLIHLEVAYPTAADTADILAQYDLFSQTADNLVMGSPMFSPPVLTVNP